MIYLNDDIAHFDWQEALPLLSEQRREQCLRFKFELGRQTCAAAYLLLRQGMREEYGITEPPVFEYGEHGKPMIAGQPHIHFNLSHCREAAICVLSDQPVGCDIESIRKFKESLVRYTMTDDEQALIAQSPQPDRAFVRLWTQKEAVLKLIGTGITDNLKNVLTTFTGHLETIVSPDKNYIYSIARAGETKHVKL
jgi:4'-phosphopantetheinyl transferase